MKATSKHLELECKPCPNDENIMLVILADGEERRFHRPLFDMLFELEEKPAKKDKKEI